MCWSRLAAQCIMWFSTSGQTSLVLANKNVSLSLKKQTKMFLKLDSHIVPFMWNWLIYLVALSKIHRKDYAEYPKSFLFVLYCSCPNFNLAWLLFILPILKFITLHNLVCVADRLYNFKWILEARWFWFCSFCWPSHRWLDINTAIPLFG
jgi:hypothetical protein